MGEGPTKVKPSRPLPLRREDELPYLEVLSGSARGQRYWLESNQAVLGRSPDLRIRLDDDGVSREHAKIVISDDGIVNLVDLGSTNGTFVNSNRVDVTVVREGDRLQLGPDVHLRFGYGDRDEASEAPAEPPERLSAREMEIADLVAEGLTNAEIGKRLHISPYTVMTHLSNVYARLDLRSRAELTKLVATGRVKGPA